MLRINAHLRNDDGNALIPVILVSLLVGVLAALTLATGEQADWASAKDRNHEVALGVTEAGVHEAVARVEQSIRSSFLTTLTDSGRTEEGGYTFTVTRAGESFVIDAVGTVAGGMRQQRKRHVKVTLEPPEMFPGAGYALFSKTNLYLKNNNEIYDGDVWANDSLWAEVGATIDGSVTSAQSWVKLENGATVTGSVWAGGRRCDVDGQIPCTSGWGINLGSGGHIAKWAKSSVSTPNCAGENTNAYKVLLNGNVDGDVTSLGPKQGTGTVGGRLLTGQCTSSQPRKDPPVFTFNRWNYDQSTYLECPSATCPVPQGSPAGAGAAAFNAWLTPERKAALEGTFAITECGGGIVNISGAEIAGDVTIVTNPQPCANGVTGARIRTEGIDDTNIPSGERATLVLVSHYQPPAGTPCTDQQDTYCAVSAKNHFDSTCKTATLVYSDNGPVSMKNDTGPNDNVMCGSIIANGIHMKNGLQLTYDPIFDRVLGFGPRVYEIVRWEELPVS